MIEADANLDEGNCLLRLSAQALQIKCNENYINDKQLGRGKPWYIVLQKLKLQFYSQERLAFIIQSVLTVNVSMY